MGSKKLNYTRCAVICHGKSEFQIAKFIKSNLHLKMEIFAKNKGESSIQITSLMDFIDKKIFTNIKKFAEDYSIEKNKNQLIGFKIFIIMDTDDCTELQKENFLNKQMFNNHPLNNYICPIANIPDLENVLMNSGIMFKKIKKKDKGDYYIETFPINSEPLSFNSYNEVKTLRDKLKSVKNTKLDEFLTYCLDLIKLT